MSEQNEIPQNGGASSIIEQKAKEVSERARHRAEAYSEQAQQRIDEKRDEVASNIESAATRVRTTGDRAGPIGHAAGEQVARQMDSAAGYLHTHQSNEIARDVIAYIRKHPVRSAIGAFVGGYFLGRLMG